MQCPACSGKLEKVTAGDVTVDACTRGCYGIWFDEQELKKFDEEHEFLPEKLVKPDGSSAVSVDHSKIRKCPCCQDEALVRQYFDPKNQVEINQCWRCSGIWLDQGEIESIRKQYKTADERKAAVESYASECVAASAKVMAKEGEERRAEEMQRLKNSSAFERFITGFGEFLTR